MKNQRKVMRLCFKIFLYIGGFLPKNVVSENISNLTGILLKRAFFKFSRPECKSNTESKEKKKRKQ